MKAIIGLALLLLVACTPSEETVHKTTADVDLGDVPAFLAALNGQVGGALDVTALASMTDSVSMDTEKQEKLPLSFNGQSTTLVYHVWREQADWVHLYLSSPSEALIDTVKTELARFARPAEE